MDSCVVALTTCRVQGVQDGKASTAVQQLQQNLRRTVFSDTFNLLTNRVSASKRPEQEQEQLYQQSTDPRRVKIVHRAADVARIISSGPMDKCGLACLPSPLAGPLPPVRRPTVPPRPPTVIQPQATG
ncbi:hypothetical protein E2C01_007695 [Portunus trituberculatus]|uniref:Uncharacterized protein n=1 Tax=Portunus trituberculatus TaxID=210409 RepID=A0A5B7CYT2_PORTR|nr:hypothetical protein [Portunus trituberculatus]